MMQIPLEDLEYQRRAIAAVVGVLDGQVKNICLELALDTTKKWNLKHHLGDKLKAL